MRNVLGAARFLVPGSLETRTGGFYYDKRIIEGLRRLGHAIDVIELRGDYPLPTRRDLGEAEGRFEAEGLLVVDGLALAALEPSLTRRPDVVPLIHHRLALETGLSADIRARLDGAERRVLSGAPHILCTSNTTAEDLRSLNLPGRITVVVPGTDPAPPVHRILKPEGPFRLLSVGSLTPRKGHDVLIEALAGLKDLEWDLAIIGGADHDPETAASLRDQVKAAEMDHRITLAGSIAHDDLHSYYAQSDLFVLASHYEGYGMAYAEALSYGLPVIGTTGGAIPEVVPKEAGLLIAPGDLTALRTALRSFLTDPELRRVLHQGAGGAKRRLPGWDQQAALFAEALGWATDNE